MSWPLVKLGDLVDIRGGGTPSKQVKEYWNGEIPWASVKDFKSNILLETQDYITQEGVDSSATNIIPAGTIVVPTRMALGKVAVTGCQMAINQDLKALIIKDQSQVCTNFFLRFLENKAGYIIAQGQGATVKGIKLEVLRELKVPLPPLPEQKRIAAILDNADQLRQKRQQAITLADDFLRSVFLDMFGDPVTNPKGWETQELDSCLTFLTSGSRGWAKYYSESGSKFIRIQNVGKNELLLDDMAYVNAPDGAESKRTKVQNRDVLLSITADLGRSSLVTDDIAGGHINQHLALLRVDQRKLNPRFLSAYLSSRGGVQQFELKNKSAVKSGLNFTDIKTLKMLLPPIELQNQYEAAYERIKLFKERLLLGIDGSSDLFNALSQKAFAGEL